MTTYQYKDRFIRQMDLIPFDVLNKKITVVGAGAVGSWAVLQLIKMGFINIEVWDYDTVDVENMNSQCYPVSSIGRLKVEAMRDTIKFMTDVTINIKPVKYEGTPILGDIVIAALDSMAGRKLMWDNCHARYFIDPRMAAEKMLLYVVDKQSDFANHYPKSLYSDADAVREPCTAKATAYCANVLAGLVCQAVKNIATGENYAKNTSFDLSNHDCLIFKEREDEHRGIVEGEEETP